MTVSPYLTLPTRTIEQARADIAKAAAARVAPARKVEVSVTPEGVAVRIGRVVIPAEVVS